MNAGRTRSYLSVNRRQLVLAALLTLTVYLAADPGPRDTARMFLTSRIIPGLLHVDPKLVGDRIWQDTCPPSESCNLFGQIIRLPGALIDTARYVAGTGWPGIAVGALTVLFMIPMISGSLDNPLMWPFAVLLGSFIAGIFLWVLKWILIGVAAALVWILWVIAALAGWILGGDWVMRGFEIRRAIAGGHGGAAPAPKAIRPGGAGPAGGG